MINTRISFFKKTLHVVNYTVCVMKYLFMARGAVSSNVRLSYTAWMSIVNRTTGFITFITLITASMLYLLQSRSRAAPHRCGSQPTGDLDKGANYGGYDEYDSDDPGSEYRI